MATPRGTFELKYFFGSHVATEAGGAASSTAIRALIKQLVAAENAKAPLSDARISQILGEQQTGDTVGYFVRPDLLRIWLRKKNFFYTEKIASKVRTPAN